MLSTATRSTVLLSIPLLVALTSCSVPGGGESTECLVGKTWVRDLPDSAQQLGAQLVSNGLNVIDSTGEGRETIEFDADGTARIGADVTYTISIAADTGMTLTLVQTHAGEPSGGWAWAGDSTTVTFIDWQNNGYAILNTVLVNGVAAESPMDFPAESLGGSAMATQCSGDSLTTQSEGSTFLVRWNAER